MTMRVRSAAVGVLAVTACAGSALAQHHEEIQVAVDAQGRLHMHTHAHMPFMVPESPFAGIPGYATAEVALASMPTDHPAIGLFVLPANVDIRAVLVAADPGMQVFGIPQPLQIGQEIAMGAPVIHVLPVWHLPNGVPGQEYGISFYFRDASGQFQDSEVFELTFMPVPAPGAAALLGVGALGLCARRRR
jgi:hypothetical protein